MEESKKGPSAVERETTTREYIKALLEYVKDDVRQDYLRVTGALAFAAIFVTHVRIAELQRLNRWRRSSCSLALAAWQLQPQRIFTTSVKPTLPAARWLSACSTWTRNEQQRR
jgi:hypothetical protein